MVDGNYPCGGAFGCGHRVDDHVLNYGCKRCPCEFVPADWDHVKSAASTEQGVPDGE